MAAHQAPPSLGFSRQEHWSVQAPVIDLLTRACKRAPSFPERITQMIKGIPPLLRVVFREQRRIQVRIERIRLLRFRSRRSGRLADRACIGWRSRFRACRAPAGSPQKNHAQQQYGNQTICFHLTIPCLRYSGMENGTAAARSSPISVFRMIRTSDSGTNP